MYLSKTPFFIQRLFPQFTWRIPTEEQNLYLTFDDGPIPEVTPWILDTLDSYNAKASFFCVGENVKKHPQIFNRIIQEGHQAGNHTYKHLNGWRTSQSAYLEDVKNCQNLMSSKLFRPPYGRIKPAQAKRLRANHDIIMWDVLSGDFDPKKSAEDCLTIIKKHSKSGSIIVLHDNIKTANKLRSLLPKILEWGISEGYGFNSITDIDLAGSSKVSPISNSSPVKTL